jgi:predicted GNAT family acetyltransferase
VFRDEQGTGELRYNIVGSHIILEHTEVDPALRGRGVAGSLAKAGLEYARANNLTVIPVCPFVIAFLARHPEYQALLDHSAQRIGPREP